jgi:hypothetical protein
LRPPPPAFIGFAGAFVVRPPPAAAAIVFGAALARAFVVVCFLVVALAID